MMTSTLGPNADESQAQASALSFAWEGGRKDERRQAPWSLHSNVLGILIESGLLSPSLIPLYRLDTEDEDDGTGQIRAHIDDAIENKEIRKTLTTTKETRKRCTKFMSRSAAPTTTLIHTPTLGAPTIIINIELDSNTNSAWNDVDVVVSNSPPPPPPLPIPFLGRAPLRLTRLLGDLERAAPDTRPLRFEGVPLDLLRYPARSLSISRLSSACLAASLSSISLYLSSRSVSRYRTDSPSLDRPDLGGDTKLGGSQSPPLSRSFSSLRRTRARSPALPAASDGVTLLFSCSFTPPCVFSVSSLRVLRTLAITSITPAVTSDNRPVISPSKKNPNAFLPEGLNELGGGLILLVVLVFVLPSPLSRVSGLWAWT